MRKVDYAKIREENIKNYGTKTHHLAYFADIYSARTHFIFEVLQNAEDALSRRPLPSTLGYVRFHLHHDRLEIYHNGKPFDNRDIIGICGIGEGTKAGDYTQIGKFGIGFKSVYAYSFFPQIHSEDEHFEIRRFVEPYEITITLSEDTLIVLPFDQLDKRPEWAFRKSVNADLAQFEISQAIKKLNIRTLLFLNNIEKIEWILPNGEQGFLTKENKLENKQNHWRIVEVRDHQGKREQWHIFARTIAVIDEDKEEQVTVEVAFLMDKNGKITRENDTELVISFPTEKKTELGFLIQAPFKATKSRDNIKSDDLANHQMIQTAAQLAADSLSVLRDANRLAVNSYNALPLDENDFPEDNFFRPIYNRIYEALKNKSLLPAHGGSYITSDNAKLARGKELVGLISSKQLGELFNKEKTTWLDASITSDTLPEFHSYLRNLVDKVEVTPESLVPKLTAGFFSKQSLAWLIQFIQYADEGAKILRRTPFIRLESGEQVALPEISNSKPTAWFVPSEAEKLDLSAFALVHTELAANKFVRTFLEKEGVREIDSVDMVVKSILRKYQKEPIPFIEADYRADLRQIRKAFADSNDDARVKFVGELNTVTWLACVYASGKESDKIFWKQQNTPNLYEQPNLPIPDRVNAYFLHPSVSEELNTIESTKDFLKKCLTKIVPLDFVERHILPTYPKNDSTFDESNYRNDLNWIHKAYIEGDISAKIKLKNSLKDKNWLVCHKLNNNGYIHYKNQNEPNLFSNNLMLTWFQGISNEINAYFLHPTVTSILRDVIDNLACTKNSPVITKTPDHEGYITILSYKGNHKRGLNGFDPDWEIVGLDEVINNPDLLDKRDVQLWEILKQHNQCIRGKIITSKHNDFRNPNYEDDIISKIGRKLIEKAWLPDKDGQRYKPSELLLTDLLERFDSSSINAKEVAEKLGMKKPGFEKAADELSKGNPRKRELLEWISNASEDELEKFEKLKPKMVMPQPAPSFKEGIGNLYRPQRGGIASNEAHNSNNPLSNPERYQKNANQEIEEKVIQHKITPQIIRFSLVRESPSNQKVRDFLYEEYQGRCQITNNTFLKASANTDGDAENYFEACSLLPYGNADYLNDAGNMLCVSADTLAKLKNASFVWLEDLNPIIENFKNRRPAKIESVKVKINLAEDECEITWSERHFARFVALWDKT
ncbi:sacsin N-terminal ATP-binding-like domain-containing protein [Methylovulum psychrotolerans]|uniref:Sacsin/Nov domain-containing protein n=1 Tax=Methylovulum psychrotolerans TaxID=1704499 RepID=A0A1Z4BZM4_9GAMM|nr:hypothetical protein [Methylovulum psychrotolerans]ASF46699.1 hypothetical protein CEK71_11775 [Methylovulum psychrotolerans]